MPPGMQLIENNLVGTVFPDQVTYFFSIKKRGRISNMGRIPSGLLGPNISIGFYYIRFSHYRFCLCVGPKQLSILRPCTYDVFPLPVGPRMAFTPGLNTPLKTESC